MTTEDILTEMENLLLDATRVPLSNKRIIEEDDLARLIDALREALPGEILEAKRIVSDRQRLLEESQQESQRIMSQAQAYATKMTEENTIVRQAQEKANELLRNAQMTAQELQNNAVSYTSDVFKYVDGVLSKTLEVVRQEQRNLQKNPKE